MAKAVYTKVLQQKLVGLEAELAQTSARTLPVWGSMNPRHLKSTAVVLAELCATLMLIIYIK